MSENIPTEESEPAQDTGEETPPAHIPWDPIFTRKPFEDHMFERLPRT